jgi:MinD-like ATPase involved in chromosome partitioning or flagellar assembly
VSLCIASGKGGTGKSVVTASLAALFAPRGRTLLVDADFGVGNAHILHDVAPRATCVDVVEGGLGVREALVACGKDLDLLAAGSGVPRMAELSSYELHVLASGLREVESSYRYVLVDSAAGVSHQTMAFARAVRRRR